MENDSTLSHCGKKEDQNLKKKPPLLKQETRNHSQTPLNSSSSEHALEGTFSLPATRNNERQILP